MDQTGKIIVATVIGAALLIGAIFAKTSYQLNLPPSGTVAPSPTSPSSGPQSTGSNPPAPHTPGLTSPSSGPLTSPSSAPPKQ